MSPDAYVFGGTKVPDITGFDSVRNIYISRDGHAWKVDNSTGLWYDMGVASDYYATLSPGPTSSGGIAPIFIGGLILAALIFTKG